MPDRLAPLEALLPALLAEHPPRPGCFPGLVTSTLLPCRTNFSTVRSSVCVFKGRWMYEVQLGSSGIMQVCFFGCCVRYVWYSCAVQGQQRAGCAAAGQVRWRFGSLMGACWPHPLSGEV